MRTVSDLIRLLSSNGSESDCYAVAVAFTAAGELLRKDPSEFEHMFGSVGKELIQEYNQPAPNP